MSLVHDVALGGTWLLVAFVMVGIIPLAVASYLFLLVALHRRRNHYDRVGDHLPRTAILIPAWNEEAVIGASIDRLMLLDYPRDRLRICVVDDASTDDTPRIVQDKALEYPGNVVHMRREQGGQGKAHTLNHGLALLLGDEWMEALLIMDADVIYEPPSLKKMARHLADPEVGAVTAYIKEGSRPGNYMTRFIGYEYITAQAAARRSQNVLGVLACLAGGAQLHSRVNIEAIGGRIDTSSLAEDTFTTFKTQLAGRKVVFEPHAVVWAEEPGSIDALWKQRLRWARGNVQVTSQFRHLWFRPQAGNRLGSFTFGLAWFCLFLLPVLMILISVSLVTLYFIDFPLSWATFHLLWIGAGLCYLFTTLYAFGVDPATARHTWKEGVLFPGAISLTIIVYACFPRPTGWIVQTSTHLVGVGLTHHEIHLAVLFAYLWLAASMPVAWLARVLEPTRWGRVLSPVIVYVVGYGPLLCAVTFNSYVKELRGAAMTWDKTEKSGKVGMPA